MRHQSITQLVRQPRVFNDKEQKELWEYYHSLGRAATHELVREYAQKKGMYNPEKGEVSRMGPYFAMWRYAYEHPKEAYPAWEEWALEYKQIFDENDIKINFNTFLKEVGQKVLTGRIRSKDKVEAWCKRWNVDYKSLVIEEISV